MMRHLLFGPGRFHPRFDSLSVQAGGTHLADRTRTAPPVESPRQTCNVCDPQKPKAWPYDTPLPTGLPQLPELPGQQAAYLLGGLVGVSPSLTVGIHLPLSDTAASLRQAASSPIAITPMVLEPSAKR